MQRPWRACHGDPRRDRRQRGGRRGRRLGRRLVAVKVLGRDGRQTISGAEGVPLCRALPAGARHRRPRARRRPEPGVLRGRQSIRLWVDASSEAAADGIVGRLFSRQRGHDGCDTPANTPGSWHGGVERDLPGLGDGSTFSDFGSRLDLAAPGENILSTEPLAGSPLARICLPAGPAWPAPSSPVWRRWSRPVTTPATSADGPSSSRCATALALRGRPGTPGQDPYRGGPVNAGGPWHRLQSGCA